MYNFQRRSTTGSSTPSWLATPGPALLKRHVRKSKFDPLVDEVELIEANPNYAHIRFPDGREDTVVLKLLAPKNDQEARKDSQAQKQLSNDSNEPSVPSTKPKIANNESDREHAPHDSSIIQPTAVPYHGDLMPPQQSSHKTVSPSPQTSNETSSPPLRRSQRQRRPPDRYKSMDYL